MKSISFFVPGIPKGQPRPKAFARRFGDKWMARVYDPGTAEHWKSQIAIAAKQHLPSEKLEGPLLFRLEAFFPRPKNHFRKNGTLKDNAPTYVEPKPDYDNTAKAVSDCLGQLGFYRDDAQIVAHVFVKRYESGLHNAKDENGYDTGYRSGAQIEIRELGIEQVETERLLEL